MAKNLFIFTFLLFFLFCSLEARFENKKDIEPKSIKFEDDKDFYSDSENYAQNSIETDTPEKKLKKTRSLNKNSQYPHKQKRISRQDEKYQNALYEDENDNGIHSK